MNKKIKKLLIIFIVVLAIVAVKTGLDFLKFVSVILVMVGVFWLMVDYVFKKKGCEVCYNTIAEMQDEDEKIICLSCYNKQTSGDQHNSN